MCTLFIRNSGSFAAFQFIVKTAYTKVHLNGFVLINCIHSGEWGYMALLLNNLYMCSCNVQFSLRMLYWLRTVHECLKDKTFSRK